MVTEEVTINRNQLWLSYEEVLEKNNDNLLESRGYICYFNREKPQLILGESIKEGDGNARRFDTIDKARNIAKVILQRTIYPPFFLDPQLYEMGNIEEIMHKPIKIKIGQTSGNIEETVEGKIISCTHTPSNANELGRIIIELENSETRSFTIFDLQKFIKP